MEGANAFKANGLANKGALAPKVPITLRVKGTDWRGGEGASVEGAAVTLRMPVGS